MVTKILNPKVDAYLIEGCGRCPLGNTPKCKVNNWKEELNLLRLIVSESELKEEVKWGVPCYTSDGKNIIMIGAFKESCFISFFKGALIKNTKGLLSKLGENSQAGRVIRFTNLKEIKKNERIIKTYIQEAIEIEKSGMKMPQNKLPEPIPHEFQLRLDAIPTLKTAFESLTPGRQRSYILHISQPKQSKTRESRIDKCIPKIFSGKGFNEY
jgi:uncharacterized protein YdeI (YjbR/CyaY-like superfamily)